MNLENLGEKARRTRTENKNFFKLIKKNRLRELDDFVHYLNEETFSHINCLECANCCRTLGPRITDKDIERMSKKLRMKPHEIVNSYLRIDEDNDYVFKEMPCPFLGNDNYCHIYEDRPKACREYPHTDRKKFYQIHSLAILNTETCPAVYQILERLKKEF